MPKDVVLSLNPKWIKPIFQTKEKIFEVRKRAPLQQQPFKVYVYCTKNGEEKWLAGVIGKRKSYKLNGTICGEFTCTAIYDIYPPFKNEVKGTGLTAKQLWEYSNGNSIYYMSIDDPIIYDEPKTLEEFGLSRPPQSWSYVKDLYKGD